MQLVLLQTGTVDHYVIQIHCSIGFCSPQKPIHHPLKCCRGPMQAKGEHYELKVSKKGSESCHLLAHLSEWNLLVPLSKVQSTYVVGTT